MIKKKEGIMLDKRKKDRTKNERYDKKNDAR